MKSILKMALITMSTMAAANYLSSINAQARKLFKGSVVAPVTTNQSATGTSWWAI